MKMTLQREFYIPRESQGRTNIESTQVADAVIYTARRDGVPWQGRKERAKMMDEIKAKRTAPHTLKVGDILVSSWGYDQTNIDYYQVVRVVGAHSVEIRQIVAKSHGEDGFMTGMVSPVPDSFKGDPMLKRCNAGNMITLTSYSHASQWDGKPDRCSWYA